MAVLTVDVGGTPISLAVTRGGHAAPRRVGPVTFGNSGTEESSVRGELMVVPFVTTPISLATAASLRTLFANGEQVPCSGDLFNKAGTITCSASLTDELRETADTVILSGTLYEIGTELTVGGTSSTTTFVFTDEDDPEEPTVKVAEEDPVGGVSGACFYTLLDQVPPSCSSGPGVTSCAIEYSDVAERVWVGPEFTTAGFLTGTPTAVFLTKGTPGGAGYTVQSSLIRIYLVRGGIDPTTDAVFGPIDSNYRAGPFDGGDVTWTWPNAIVWPYEIGDRLRFEIWSRIALAPDAVDVLPDPMGYDLTRQTICYGTGYGVTLGNVVVPSL